MQAGIVRAMNHGQAGTTWPIPVEPEEELQHGKWQPGWPSPKLALYGRTLIADSFTEKSSQAFLDHFLDRFSDRKKLEIEPYDFEAGVQIMNLQRVGHSAKNVHE